MNTYEIALEVIERAVSAIMTHSKSDYTIDVYSFENDMNALSGSIVGMDSALRQQINNAVEVVIWGFNSKGFEVKLIDSLLNANVSHGTTEVITQQGKRLYPLTTSLEVEVYKSGSAGVAVVAPSLTTEDANTIATLADDLPEEIDEVFEEIDAEVVTEDEPLSTSENEFIPLISNSLIEIANTAAAYLNLQDGLVEFSQNPLTDLIEDTRELLLYYTEGNYANLNTALSMVYADVALATEFEKLKETLGGPDGLSGCVIQLDIFKEHTDRLAGLNLDSSSPNDETDNDSTSEYLNLNDYSGGPQVLFSFDARRFRSAKYLIQASAANTSRGHQATEIYILHDNHHAYTREITSVYSNEPFCTYTTRLLNANVEVLANTSAPNTDFVISGTRLRIARQSNAYGEISQVRIIEQHESLASYLNDGVDYVELQSASLLKGYLVANLARDFRDTLAVLRDTQWLAQSTPNKQAGITNFTSTLASRRQEIQSSIDTDYNNFVAARKKVEALDIAYALTTAYTDSTGNAIPSVTLNTSTISAIESEE